YIFTRLTFGQDNVPSRRLSAEPFLYTSTFIAINGFTNYFYTRIGFQGTTQTLPHHGMVSTNRMDFGWASDNDDRLSHKMSGSAFQEAVERCVWECVVVA